MQGTDVLTVYGAAYGRIDEAMKDYAGMQKLHEDRLLGDYDSVMVTKEPSGYLVVSNGDASGRFKSTVKGAVAGGLLAMVFPASVLGMSALGATAGAVTGQVARHLKRRDMKELGDLLKPGETGIVLITEEVTDLGAAGLFPLADSSFSVEVEGFTS